ncbi:MAG: DUF4097 family beta strand repeat protein [Clostridia bacterium]|nr:DUF4097 family beta strand repeat protein [Clostridia bacterium]
MNTGQKIIKYLALALAISLIVGIFSGIFKVLVVVTGLGQITKSPILENPTQWAVSQNVTQLEVEIQGLELTILPDTEFRVETDSKYVTRKESGNKLTIKEKKNSWLNPSGGRIVLYVPADHVFDQVHIEAGTGDFSVVSLQTNKLDLDLGAGEVTFGTLNVWEEAEIDGGAGKIHVQNGTLTDLDLDMGVGELLLTAQLKGKNQVDCGVGNVELTLIGAEDYRICLDKGIGSATLNDEPMEDNAFYGNGENTVEISGGIGSIAIDLAYIGVAD